MNNKRILSKVLLKLSLNKDESSEIANQLKNLPKEKRDDELQKIVNEKNLKEEDIKELLYDLRQIGFLNLKKPSPVTETNIKDETIFGWVTPYFVQILDEDIDKVLKETDLGKEYAVEKNIPYNEFLSKIKTLDFDTNSVLDFAFDSNWVHFYNKGNKLFVLGKTGVIHNKKIDTIIQKYKDKYPSLIIQYDAR